MAFARNVNGRERWRSIMRGVYVNGTPVYEIKMTARLR